MTTDETKEPQEAEAKDRPSQKISQAEEVNRRVAGAVRKQEDAAKKRKALAQERKAERDKLQGEAKLRGAEFREVSGGVGAGGTALRAQHATKGPPREAPATVQSEGGVEANTLAEHRQHLKAAQEVNAVFTESDANGAKLRKTPTNDQEVSEQAEVGAAALNARVGRLGTMAPLMGNLADPARALGTAPLNPFGANVPPNYVVMDFESI